MFSAMLNLGPTRSATSEMDSVLLFDFTRDVEQGRKKVEVL